jgi:CMD domain protein
MSTISSRSADIKTYAADVADLLAALEPRSRIAHLRLVRGEVRSATQGSFEALFEPGSYSGLPRVERELVALRVAALQHDAPLAAFHRERARSRGADPTLLNGTERHPDRPVGSDRWTEVLRFVDRLTLDPALARPAHLKALHRHGFVPRDIVTLAQVVAFTNYQVRLLAGLRALVAVEPGDAPSLTVDEAPRRGGHAPSEHTPAERGFTLDPLAWTAWLPTVNPATADAEQLAVLDESNASARTSPYYLTLIHDPAVLRQRSRLFNAIMYAPGGLPRPERELTTVAVSIVNGCPYCASVHARLFAQLSKEPQAVQALFDEGLNTSLAPRRRALIDLGVALSANPPEPPEGHLLALRSVGLDDEEILDAVHAAAIFAWANRLMQTLGEPVAERG